MAGLSIGALSQVGPLRLAPGRAGRDRHAAGRKAVTVTILSSCSEPWARAARAGRRHPPRRWRDSKNPGPPNDQVQDLSNNFKCKAAGDREGSRPSLLLQPVRRRNNFNLTSGLVDRVPRSPTGSAALGPLNPELQVSLRRAVTSHAGGVIAWRGEACQCVWRQPEGPTARNCYLAQHGHSLKGLSGHGGPVSLPQPATVKQISEP